jgi:hypothetical protein
MRPARAARVNESVLAAFEQGEQAREGFWQILNKPKGRKRKESKHGKRNEFRE